MEDFEKWVKETLSGKGYIVKILDDFQIMSPVEILTWALLLETEGRILTGDNEMKLSPAGLGKDSFMEGTVILSTVLDLTKADDEENIRRLAWEYINHENMINPLCVVTKEEWLTTVEDWGYMPEEKSFIDYSSPYLGVIDEALFPVELLANMSVMFPGISKLTTLEWYEQNKGALASMLCSETDIDRIKETLSDLLSVDNGIKITDEQLVLSIDELKKMKWESLDMHVDKKIVSRPAGDDTIVEDMLNKLLERDKYLILNRLSLGKAIISNSLTNYEPSGLFTEAIIKQMGGDIGPRYNLLELLG